jgi:hypothetical protein
MGLVFYMPLYIFIKFGMFSEQYKNCYEDVQLNLTALINDRSNYCCGSAVAFHHESATRNKNQMKQIQQNEDMQKLYEFVRKNSTFKKIKEMVYKKAIV